MTEGFVYWRNASGVTEIPVFFTPGEELPAWSLTALLSKVVHNTNELREATRHIKSFKAITHSMHRFGDRLEWHTMVGQLELEDAVDHLVSSKKLARRAATTIMSFMEDVPTPTPHTSQKKKKNQKGEKRAASEVNAEEELRLLKKGKQEEDEESSSVGGGDEGEPYWQPQREPSDEEEEPSGEEPAGAEPFVTTNYRHLIDQVMVGTRLLDSMRHLVDAPLIDQAKPVVRPYSTLGTQKSNSSSSTTAGVFKTFREREDAILFMRNVYRSLPRKQILGFLTGEDGDEEDDSQVVTVGQRTTQLGYTMPEASTYAGRTLRMEIGLLATRYYRELHEQRDPPQIYRVMHGGQRMLVNKWTLNNCCDTLDRAIHTVMQGKAKETSL